MKIEAYVFIEAMKPGPRAIVRAVRGLEGVVRVDGLLGTPDVIAIVEGTDIASMDAVIDRIVEVPGVAGTDSKVVRWID